MVLYLNCCIWIRDERYDFKLSSMSSFFLLIGLASGHDPWSIRRSSLKYPAPLCLTPDRPWVKDHCKVRTFKYYQAEFPHAWPIRLSTSLIWPILPIENFWEGNDPVDVEPVVHHKLLSLLSLLANKGVNLDRGAFWWPKFPRAGPGFPGGLGSPQIC